jgi:lipid-binding SYLF domain-containing protein
MNKSCLLLSVAAFNSLAGLAPDCLAQTAEDSIVRSSSAVLGEIMAVPLAGIPQSMLADAHGIAIIPKVLKGSFVIGARHGRGVLLIRNDQGFWHAPVFISLTGGNIGWQIGVQSTDVILVFKTRKSVEGILAGKFTLGADATAAAGPIGRQAAAATDMTLQAEIYSYSRSRGLFAGVSFDGSVMSVDRMATGAYYRSPGPGQPAIVPDSALRLTQSVATYAGIPKSAAQRPALVRPARASGPELLRGQLAQIAPRRPVGRLFGPAVGGVHRKQTSHIRYT